MFAYMATHAVNSFVADIMFGDDLTDVLRDLPNYVVDEFCLTVIQDVIAEILKYRAIINATPAEFWSWVEGAETCNKALSKKMEANPEK